jgi:hypothetical protein
MPNFTRGVPKVCESLHPLRARVTLSTIFIYYLHVHPARMRPIA